MDILQAVKMGGKEVKRMNKYDGMTYKELLKEQPEVITMVEIRQFHRALCKVQKDMGVPFWRRGMPLMARYPYLPEYFSVFCVLVASIGLLVAIIAMIATAIYR